MHSVKYTPEIMLGKLLKILIHPKTWLPDLEDTYPQLN